MSYDKTTIRIDSATPGWKLDVWQVTPKDRSKPFPTIVMAHGFCGRKMDGLMAFAEAFVLQAGCACLLFDYRHYGDSDGTPRNVLIPSRQVEDYRTVLPWARKQPQLFDSSKLGIWGTSYSGGHAFTVAAEEGDGVFLSISECPLVDGVAAALIVPPLHALKMGAYAVASTLKQLFGGAPIYMPAHGKHNAWAFLNQKDADSGYELVGQKDSDAANRVDCQVVLYSLVYRPTAVASRIKCPLLCCIGTEDSMVPTSAAHSAIAKVPKGEVAKYTGGHFAPYKGGEAHDAVLEAQVAFIKRNL